jgi:hypothetical protein
LIDVKKLSVLAITALLLTGISGITTAAAAKPAPTTTSLPITSLTTLITSLINSVGDDTFSTIDLTTLLATYTMLTPTPLHASTSAVWTQPTSSSSETSTQHYGPYASGSPDSGTCGNNWADDTFDRHFTVFQNRDDGSFLVVEQFKDGSFVTPSATPAPPLGVPPNSSPGGCQNSATTQGTVKDGVTGSMHGYFVIPLPAGSTQTSTSSACFVSPQTECTTYNFLNSHFTGCSSYPNGPCTVTTFFDHYTATGQGLIINEWKNASSDRGGNHGDIRSANVP